MLVQIYLEESARTDISGNSCRKVKFEDGTTESAVRRWCYTRILYFYNIFMLFTFNFCSIYTIFVNDFHHL
jgi:hypothetical protein